LGKRVHLVVGLGNPGSKYKETRHNVGFKVIDNIADVYSISVSKNWPGAMFGRGAIEDIDMILAKPTSFMNNSGPPVKNLADYFNISKKNIIVIHDDIDLELGRIKIKEKGGHGGHNGIRSLVDVLKGGDFVRLRIGIGRPGDSNDVSDYVLSSFHNKDVKAIEQAITRARDAVVTIICNGIIDGMNTYNIK
jgi:PTH1 family peptidyl-tRNA hydrolase